MALSEISLPLVGLPRTKTSQMLNELKKREWNEGARAGRSMVLGDFAGVIEQQFQT